MASASRTCSASSSAMPRSSAEPHRRRLRLVPPCARRPPCAAVREYRASTPDVRRGSGCRPLNARLWSGALLALYWAVLRAVISFQRLVCGLGGARSSIWSISLGCSVLPPGPVRSSGCPSAYPAGCPLPGERAVWGCTTPLAGVRVGPGGSLGGQWGRYTPALQLAAYALAQRVFTFASVLQAASRFAFSLLESRLCSGVSAFLGEPLATVNCFAANAERSRPRAQPP